jgi:hypothetical protein
MCLAGYDLLFYWLIIVVVGLIEIDFAAVVDVIRCVGVVAIFVGASF